MILRFGNAEHYVDEKQIRGLFFNERTPEGLVEAVLVYKKIDKEFKFKMTDIEFEATVRTLEIIK